MANAIEEYLAETLKGIGGKLVNGKLEFDDPAKNEAWKETLSRAGGTIDAPRPSTADDSLANAAKAGNQLLQQDAARAGLQVQTAKDLLPVRAARQAGDSNTYARDLTTNVDQMMRVLGERGRQISGLDEGMTGRHDSSIAYFDRNDERRLALEREKLAAQKSGRVYDMIGRLLQGAAIFAL
jgi:hypothetical protein